MGRTRLRLVSCSCREDKGWCILVGVRLHNNDLVTGEGSSHNRLFVLNTAGWKKVGRFSVKIVVNIHHLWDSDSATRTCTKVEKVSLKRTDFDGKGGRQGDRSCNIRLAHATPGDGADVKFDQPTPVQKNSLKERQQPWDAIA